MNIIFFTPLVISLAADIDPVGVDWQSMTSIQHVHPADTVKTTERVLDFHVFLYVSPSYVPGFLKTLNTSCRAFRRDPQPPFQDHTTHYNLIYDVYSSEASCGSPVVRDMVDQINEHVPCAKDKINLRCGRLERFCNTAAEANLIASAFAHGPAQETLQQRRDRTSAMARLFYKKIFPESRYVLFLDSDIVVHGADLGNILRLYITRTLTRNTHEQYVGAAVYMRSRTFADAYDYQQCDMSDYDPRKKQFNSGVVLLDYGKLHDSQLLATAMDLVTDCSKQKLWDQDVLNLYLYDRLLPLDLSWNYYGLGAHPDKVYTAAEYRQVSKDLTFAKIWHWSGPCKPWVQPDALMKCNTLFWRTERLLSRLDD